jgi:hypothetical protein
VKGRGAKNEGNQGKYRGKIESEFNRLEHRGLLLLIVSALACAARRED